TSHGGSDASPRTSLRDGVGARGGLSARLGVAARRPHVGGAHGAGPGEYRVCELARLGGRALPPRRSRERCRPRHTRTRHHAAFLRAPARGLVLRRGVLPVRDPQLRAGPCPPRGGVVRRAAVTVPGLTGPGGRTLLVRPRMAEGGQA